MKSLRFTHVILNQQVQASWLLHKVYIVRSGSNGLWESSVVFSWSMHCSNERGKSNTISSSRCHNGRQQQKDRSCRSRMRIYGSREYHCTRNGETPRAIALMFCTGLPTLSSASILEWSIPQCCIFTCRASSFLRRSGVFDV